MIEKRDVMKKLVLFVMLLCAAATRPVAAVGQTVEKRTFVYSVKENDTLRMDRYRIPDMRLDSSPCLVFLFGGGFTSGERDRAEYLPFFEHMARQGLTVVSIDYRLGLKRAMEQGRLDQRRFAVAFPASIAMAVEDLYDATAYLLGRAEEWRIDPSEIVICGSSAGAITVLQAEYGLCNGAVPAMRLPADFNYAGVISFAGALFVAGEEPVWGGVRPVAPMLLFHGDADSNVPYDSLRAMGAGLFGSRYIADGLTHARVPHVFYSVSGAGHEVAVGPMSENLPEIESFLEKLVFGRLPLMVDTQVRSLDRSEASRVFTLQDYIESNFGSATH